MKQSAQSAHGHCKESHNILVVDDNPRNLALLDDILSQAGYSVRPAISGKLALLSAAAKLPDLILLDIRLPDIDGYEVCRRLKHDLKTAEIPVIFLSALDDPLDKVKAFSEGGIDYITKPFQAEEIIVRIKTHLTVRQMQNTLVKRNQQLKAEVTEREKAQQLLQEAHNELESRVRLRTEELAKTVQALESEIEERLQMERQLHQAQKLEAIGTLAGGIAHDFNNILGAIIGCAEIAMTELPEGNRAQADLERVLGAGQRARQLVRQILAFSRQTETTRHPLKLQPVLKETVKFLRATLPSSIEIATHFSKDDWLVLADPVQIQQILLNLATNAAHAMDGSAGKLEIRLTTSNLSADETREIGGINSGDFFILSIRDTGHGINRIVLDRIFDPFFTTKGVGEGTGLGLSVVHGIISDLGGRVLVESTPNRGTTFIIYLPRTHQQKAKIESAVPPPHSSGGETILVVDDEPYLAESMARSLQSFGYNPVVCTNGAAALASFKESPDAFDLVLTDLTMPRMSGGELAGKIQAIRPDLPIILCTGYSDDTAEQYIKKGLIRTNLNKPVLRWQLAKAVNETMKTPSPGNRKREP